MGIALALAALVGCGAGGADAKPAVSPCGTVSVPVWSPDGTQVAWYGYRSPRPHGHAVGGYNILRAVCVSDADGKHVHPLRGTVCSEHCSTDIDPPSQLDWVGPNLLLYGNDTGTFRISFGRKPKLLATKGPDPFSADAGGDRIATGTAGCVCSGPVTVRGVPSGAVVGVVGGAKFNNGAPSLSPDGEQVVFMRSAATDPGPGPGIWIAAADGSHLRRLERSGEAPLWSPAGKQIAYAAPVGPIRAAWRLVAPRGGASTTLLRNAPGTVFGWSPDGRWITFPDSQGRLAIVDVATKKVRRLLKLQSPYDSSSVAWSPNSQQLLVLWRAPAHSNCPSGLWRVPIDGAKPRLVHSC